MTRHKNLHVLVALITLAMLATPAFAQVDATFNVDQTLLQGAHPDSGQVLLFAPNPIQGGSSISHWDTSATPSLLMEPSITPDLVFLDLDITPDQMGDIGWTQGTSNIVITPIELAPDTGFSDPRPFAGAPGNDATTLGEARTNLFNAVIGSWANTLGSDVDIDIVVVWQDQFCQPGAGAVLASAGPLTVYFDDPGGVFPFGNTWYHSALTDAIVGQDISGPPVFDPNTGSLTGGDLIVFMNTAIDNECLGAGTGYYYGLDGNNPSNTIDIAPVVLHEIGHGLGFSNLANDSTGELFQGLPNVYEQYTFDETLGQTWADMATDAERAASGVNSGNLSWSGPAVTAAAPNFLDTGVPVLTINAPADIAGNYPVGTANFGPAIPDAGLNGEIACMEDPIDLAGGDASYFNGCLPATNADELAGKIALIDRGGCSFVQKVGNAQAAGAIGAIVVNNRGNSTLALGGTDDTITIPAVSLGAGDGRTVRGAACGDTTAYIQDGRFQVQMSYDDGDMLSGIANGVELTDDSAYFTFFNPTNPEVFIKVLDGCDFNGNFWVFAAGLTNLEVLISINDTLSGAFYVAGNPLGNPFPPIQDIEAFATCP